jgi:bisanhydrobacterioruberin hydratase
MREESIIHNLFHGEKGQIWILGSVLLVSLILHVDGETRPMVLLMTDGFLFLVNIYILIRLSEGNAAGKFILWGILTLCITYFIEVVGVNTGFPFGSYLYGSTMKIKAFGVPLVIGLNWLVLILATYDLSGFISRNRTMQPALAAFMICLFDILLEPVAVKLDYWSWSGGVIPIQNYLAWFVITLIFSGSLSLFKIKAGSIMLRAFFIMQVVFFAVLLMVL